MCLCVLECVDSPSLSNHRNYVIYTNHCLLIRPEILTIVCFSLTRPVYFPAMVWLYLFEKRWHSVQMQSVGVRYLS